MAQKLDTDALVYLLRLFSADLATLDRTTGKTAGGLTPAHIRTLAWPFIRELAARPDGTQLTRAILAQLR